MICVRNYVCTNFWHNKICMRKSCKNIPVPNFCIWSSSYHAPSSFIVHKLFAFQNCAKLFACQNFAKRIACQTHARFFARSNISAPKYPRAKNYSRAKKLFAHLCATILAHRRLRAATAPRSRPAPHHPCVLMCVLKDYVYILHGISQ